MSKLSTNPSIQEKIKLFEEIESYSKHFSSFANCLGGERSIEFDILCQKFSEIYEPKSQMNDYYHYMVILKVIIEDILAEKKQEKNSLVERTSLSHRVIGILRYINNNNDRDNHFLEAEFEDELFIQLAEDLDYLINCFSYLVFEYPKTSARIYTQHELLEIGDCLLYFQENCEYDVADPIFQEKIKYLTERFENINRIQCKIMLGLIKKHKKEIKFKHNCKEIVKVKVLIDYYLVDYCDKNTFEEGYDFLWEFHELLLMDDKYISNFTRNVYKKRRKAENKYGKMDFQNFEYPSFKDDSQKTKRIHIDQYISIVVKGQYLYYENLVFLNSLIKDYEEREKIKQVIKIRKEIDTNYDEFQYIERLISDKSLLEKYEFFKQKSN